MDILVMFHAEKMRRLFDWAVPLWSSCPSIGVLDYYNNTTRKHAGKLCRWYKKHILFIIIIIIIIIIHS
ncbi:hypothetical protein QBC36DRAFT_229803 [Triangularia setosa]|uniref:Uncharacterized protein n=1 Tax=Triangularia setosa TaxID=2587417 RepID=A0AAN6WHV5_9PEZI|nr:hypothetical protein QBC36DRAFT_229803 [Podospora setosa]